MKIFKALAIAGREYLLKLEDDFKKYINELNEQQRELDEEISTETSPKKENNGDPK